MIDTAALTAAVETLQGYCEQVRLVLAAKGYEYGHASVDVGLGGHKQPQVWVFGTCRPCRAFESDKGDPFAAALAYAESLSPSPTPESIAATIGIAPDGRLLEAVEG